QRSRVLTAGVAADGHVGRDTADRARHIARQIPRDIAADIDAAGSCDTAEPIASAVAGKNHRAGVGAGVDDQALARATAFDVQARTTPQTCNEDARVVATLSTGPETGAS